MDMMRDMTTFDRAVEFLNAKKVGSLYHYYDDAAQSTWGVTGEELLLLGEYLEKDFGYSLWCADTTATFIRNGR